jgi:four helix bundle protein
MGIVLEEADETAYWLELVVRAHLLPAPRVQALLKEADELVSICVASLRTAKSG